MGKLKVVVIGAGGKMGVCTSTNLAKVSDYDLYLIESGDKGLQSIKDRGFTPYKAEDIVWDWILRLMSRRFLSGL